MKFINRDCQTGLTLIELLTAISIAIILATLAVPSFGRLFRNHQLSSRTNDLVGDLQLARSEALRRSQRISICPSANGTSCSGDSDWSVGWIIFAKDGEENPAVHNPPADELIFVRRGTSDSVETAAAVNFIQFQAQGYLRGHQDANPVVFSVAPKSNYCRSGANQERVITVQPFGSLELIRQDCEPPE